MQVYRIEAGKLAETWLMLQQLSVRVQREEWPQGKKFARRMPGETNANVACELSADADTIKPHHLPISPAPGARKGDGTPTITNGGIGIIMPDLAIGIGPTDHNPFGPHQRIRGRRGSENKQ